MHYGFENKRNNIAQDGAEPKPQLQTPSFLLAELRARALRGSQGPPGNVTGREWRSFGKERDISPAFKHMQGIHGRPATPLPPLPWRQSPLCPIQPRAQRVLELPDHHFGKGFGLEPKQLWDGSRQHQPHSSTTSQGAVGKAQSERFGFVPSLGRRQSLP